MSDVPVHPARVGGCVAAEVQRRSDGTILMRSVESLEEPPRRVTDALEHWARRAPDRCLAARRLRAGDWVHVSWAQMLERVRSVGQGLVDRKLSSQRPVVVLSGNDLEHLMLGLAALWVGVPWVPVSVPYSLLSGDGSFERLREVLRIATPGLVYAASPAFGSAIAACVPDDCEVVLGEGKLAQRSATPFQALLDVEPGAAGDAAHDAVGPDTVAKLLFTSGSTSKPKAVANTNRMICAALQMQRQCLPFLCDEPPVLVDWMPWNHTGGGNFNLGMVLNNGGTLFIDDGKPLPQAMGETLRNLREVAPTIYLSVPKGFEELAAALEEDEPLRRTFFSRLQAFMPAGAGLSQAAWDRLDRIAESTTGQRVRFIVGLGMTETGPSGTLSVTPGARSGCLGLPPPGLAVKLVPIDAKLEIRFKGPSVMTGYWRSPEQTRAAFDDEGYYRSGDAVKFADPDDPQRGLLFDGRIAEDFKLSTGSFVHVGALRIRAIAAGGLLVQDAIVTGLDRDDVGLLVVPRLEECRKLAGLGAHDEAETVLDHALVRNAFQSMIDRLHDEGSGISTRPLRLHLLREPPSMDRGEATDKGTINQRAVLACRRDLVDELHRTRVSSRFAFIAHT